MTRPDNCPHCAMSLQGTEIDPDNQHFYNALDAKPGDPGWVTHFRREIGVEVLGVYDGVLYWQCPECRDTWNRWTKERWPDLYDAAEREMNKAANS